MPGRHCPPEGTVRSLLNPPSMSQNNSNGVMGDCRCRGLYASGAGVGGRQSCPGCAQVRMLLGGVVWASCTIHRRSPSGYYFRRLASQRLAGCVCDATSGRWRQRLLYLAGRLWGTTPNGQLTDPRPLDGARRITHPLGMEGVPAVGFSAKSPGLSTGSDRSSHAGSDVRCSSTKVCPSVQEPKGKRRLLRVSFCI
jgi:hypothetical protein